MPPDTLRDRLLQLPGHRGEPGAVGDQPVGQVGRDFGERLDDDLPPADDIANGGVFQVIFDELFQTVVKLLLGVFQNLRVEAGDPGLVFVDLAGGDEVLGQGFRVQPGDR